MAYDAVIVGGGLAGASLAKSLAEAGHQILVLEREIAFKDRVRGEQMLPWGAAEARRLGIYDLLTSTCACEVRFLDAQQVGAPPAPPRDLVATSPHRAGALDFQHAVMQQVLLDAAADAGAEVRRGATVSRLAPGNRPAVVVRTPDGEDKIGEARLIVAADGRRSVCRQLGGFAVGHDPDRMVIAGVMLEGMTAPNDRLLLRQNFGTGEISIVVPLGDNRHRVYVCYHKARRQHARPLSGDRALPDFVAASVSAGVPTEWFEGSKAVGPLASFDAADTWVDKPYRHGIALLGDAAAASDPSYGCGLSLTLRGVRLLRDELLATADWDAAGHAYAEQLDKHASTLRRITNWLTDLWFEPGDEADTRRARALPRLGDDPTRMPDFIGFGPEAASDEHARQRLFGEL